MKLGIIGGGAIGLLFASFLAQENTVTVYTRSREQAQKLQKDGITYIGKSGQKKVSVNSKALSEGLENENFLIIAVKQYDLSEVLAKVSDDSSLLFLQNGMGHIGRMEELKNKNIYVGAVEHGALKEDSATVIHTGIGATKVGVYKGEQSILAEFISMASAKEFPCLREDNWLGTLYSKLLVNAVINPLTAVFNVPNGELIKNDYLKMTMRTLFNEVATAINIADAESGWGKIVSICSATAENRSSMLKDLDEGRRTEVDSILGFVLSKAAQSGKYLPVCSFLYNGIKGMEKSRGVDYV